MAEDGGSGFDFNFGSGDKGGSEFGDANWDGGNSGAGVAAGGGNDWGYEQPSFGDLGYLSGDSGAASVDTGVSYGGSDFGGDFGVAPPSSDFGSDFGVGSGGGFGGGTPVVGPDTGFIPTVGPLPPPTPGQSGHAFSADAFNYGGPAGASSVPNVGALSDSVGGISNIVSMDNPAGVSLQPGGLSAAGGLPGVGGGSGGGDLSAAGKDDGFLKKFGISNPLGAAVAAAGLGYNMLQGKKQTDEQRNLAALATPAMRTGAELTTEGRDVGRTGVDALRTRAAGVPGTMVEGSKIVADNAANLTELAKATTPNSQVLQDRGTSLTGYVGTGTLPPEMQAQVDQARSDAKTARISFYASKGMPTDPRKNTSLRSDLERIDRDAIVMASTMAGDLAKTGTGVYTAGVGGTQVAGGLFNQAGAQGTQLGDAALRGQTVAGNMEKSAADIGTGFITSGLASSGLASNAYNQLARIDEAQNANTQKAIAAMAAALAGGTPKITIGA